MHSRTDGAPQFSSAAESFRRDGSSAWRIEPWMLALAITVLAIIAGVLRVALRPAGGHESPTVHGVTLGMTPGDVRTRFETSDAGHWRNVPGDDPAMEWTADGTDRLQARFEFHSGILVAARIVVPSADPDAHGARIDVSTASVLARRTLEDGRVELTLLARDCPTHAAEVNRLLQSR